MELGDISHTVRETLFILELPRPESDLFVFSLAQFMSIVSSPALVLISQREAH